MPRIIVVRNGGEHTIELGEGVHTVGRSSRCRIQVKDGAASRIHCRLVVDGEGGLTLVDEGSRNGTLVNGRPVREEVLRPGDCIRIGESVLYVEQKPAGRTRRATTTGRRVIVKDFAEWSGAGGSLSKLRAPLRILGIGLLVLCLVGAAGAAAFVLLSGREGARDRGDNLIRRNPGFHAARGAAGWEAAGDSVRLSVSAEAGRSPGGALVVEKTLGNPVELRYSESLKLRRGRRVDAEVWVRSEDFNGLAAFRVRWLDARARPLGRDYSSTLRVERAWGKMRGVFEPPSQAAGFDLAIVMLRGTGRIFLDDIEVVNRTPARRKRLWEIGKFHLRSADRSAYRALAWQTLPLAVNLHLVPLGADGKPIEVIYGAPVKVSKGKDRELELTAPVIWGSRGEGRWTEKVTYQGGELVTLYEILPPPGGEPVWARLVFDLPGAQGLAVPEEPVRRIGFGLGSHDFEIEYPRKVRVVLEGSRQVPRLVQTFPVEGVPVRFAWQIREVSTSAEFMVKRYRRELEEVGGREPGRKRAVLKRLLELVRDPDEAAGYEKELRALDAKEDEAWRRIRLEATIALLSRRPERAERVLQLLRDFIDRFSEFGRAGRVEEVEALKKKLTVLRTVERTADEEEGRRILGAAQSFLKAGKDDLARGLLEYAAREWETGAVGQEARRILESMGK